MDAEQFWEIIENSRKKTKGKLEKQYKRLLKSLKKLSEEDILGFDAQFRLHMRTLSSMDWRTAHFIVWNYTSDEGFDDFRAWIISLGRDEYNKIAADPQYIAIILKPTGVRATLAADAILEAAEDAWLEKTGQQMPVDKRENPDNSFEEQWPETREGFQSKFPELFATFWNDQRIRMLHPELAPPPIQTGNLKL